MGRLVLPAAERPSPTLPASGKTAGCWGAQKSSKRRHTEQEEQEPGTVRLIP